MEKLVVSLVIVPLLFLMGCKCAFNTKAKISDQFPNSEIVTIDANRWLVRTTNGSVVYVEYNFNICTNTVFGPMK